MNLIWKRFAMDAGELGAQPSAEALSKVATMLFHPTSPSRDSAPRVSQAQGQPVHVDDAAFVGRLVSEALQSRAVVVVTPDDFETALRAEGLAAKGLDPTLAVEVAARVFGASSVLTGHVARYRGRDAAAVEGTHATSIVFEMSLYEVSSDRALGCRSGCSGNVDTSSSSSQRALMSSRLRREATVVGLSPRSSAAPPAP